MNSPNLSQFAFQMIPHSRFLLDLEGTLGATVHHVGRLAERAERLYELRHRRLRLRIFGWGCIRLARLSRPLCEDLLFGQVFCERNVKLTNITILGITVDFLWFLRVFTNVSNSVIVSSLHWRVDTYVSFILSD